MASQWELTVGEAWYIIGSEPNLLENPGCYTKPGDVKLSAKHQMAVSRSQTVKQHTQAHSN